MSNKEGDPEKKDNSIPEFSNMTPKVWEYLEMKTWSKFQTRFYSIIAGFATVLGLFAYFSLNTYVTKVIDDELEDEKEELEATSDIYQNRLVEIEATWSVIFSINEIERFLLFQNNENRFYLLEIRDADDKTTLEQYTEDPFLLHSMTRSTVQLTTYDGCLYGVEDYLVKLYMVANLSEFDVDTLNNYHAMYDIHELIQKINHSNPVNHRFTMMVKNCLSLQIFADMKFEITQNLNEQMFSDSTLLISRKVYSDLYFGLFESMWFELDSIRASFGNSPSFYPDPNFIFDL